MIPMPLFNLLDTFSAPQRAVEKQTNATSFNEFGEAVIAAPVVTTQQIMVHQATRKQIERANLDHVTDWHAFYSNEELRVADATGPSFVIQYAGERWELMKLANYDELGGLWIALGKRIE